MTEQTNDITADAVALQERDEFCAQGWLKLIAPAKVNLHLAIGAKRPDGYHAVSTVMHAVNLHDVVYMRRALPDAELPYSPVTRMVACGDVELPAIDSADNIAGRAVLALAEETGSADTGIEIRIEKNIPSEGGLGGGSADAAAALVGAAHLWGIPADDPVLDRAASRIGSDVAFFLHGGCSRYGGKGDEFAGHLEASKQAVALVKPPIGISTAEAYRVFDSAPIEVPAKVSENAKTATSASEIILFNNLAPASEAIAPQLAETRGWLEGHAGVRGALLCGSGATTFALCDDFSATCAVVAEARKMGFWARATSFGSARAMIVSQGDA